MTWAPKMAAMRPMSCRMVARKAYLRSDSPTTPVASIPAIRGLLWRMSPTWEFRCLREGAWTINVDTFFQPSPGTPNTAIIYWYAETSPAAVPAALEGILQSFRAN